MAEEVKTSFVWVRAKVLHYYVPTGEVDVEINNVGEGVGICVKAQDVIQRACIQGDHLFLGHKSDCALHNPPALPVGICNCGAW